MPVAFGMREPVAPQRPAAAGNRTPTTADPIRPITNRISEPYDTIPADIRSNENFKWFFDFDTNKDGQLTMLEYITGLGGIWSEGLAAEFRRLDRNGDGFVVWHEALATIEEIEKEKNLTQTEQNGSQENQRQRREGRNTVP